MRQLKIQERASGKWRSILLSLGVPVEVLNGKHQACPFCGGTDRFRFTDWHGSGSYYCNQCGRGDGFNFLMKFKGNISFKEAVSFIEQELPSAKLEIKKSSEKSYFDCDSFWAQCHEIIKYDAAGKYIQNRGIKLKKFPDAIRFHPRVKYRHDDKSITYHPCMVARFTSPDDASSILQFTFLDEDGQKAKLPLIRKSSPNPVPAGGAVKLFKKDCEKIGIAEGVETALSATQLFHVPTWASLSSVYLMKWNPPPSAKNITIFADNDKDYQGQHAAFSLAYRLKKDRKDLKITIQSPDRVDTDWNDELADLEQHKGGVTI